MKKYLRRRDLQYQIMTLPSLIGYSLFFVSPLIMTIIYSFTNFSIYTKSGVSFVGLDNYIKLFHDEAILIGIKNSITYAILHTGLVNIIAIPLAVALTLKIRTRNLLRTIFFAPTVMSMLIVSFLWKFMMSPNDYGLLNNILMAIGLDKVNWLGDPSIALISIIFTQVWQWLGWPMIIYIANLQGIPRSLYEAAEIDGAGKYITFFKITLPMLIPAVTINIVTGMIGGLKVFDPVLAMTQGGPGYATETILTVLFKRGFNEFRYAYASSYAVVFLLIVSLIAFLQLRYFNKLQRNIL